MNKSIQQDWIEKLKLVDARFAEAGWLPEYEYRKYLAEVIDGLEQLLQQANVSWAQSAELLIDFVRFCTEEQLIVAFKSVDYSVAVDRYLESINSR